MLARRFALAAGVVLVAVACSDSTDPTKGCPENVTVTATAGTKPQFSWTPACRAYQVGVRDASGSVWIMGFNFANPAKANGISSPVTFGDTLAVGDSLAPPPPAELTAGKAYTFTVVGLNAVGQSKLMGQLQFTP